MLRLLCSVAVIACVCAGICGTFIGMQWLSHYGPEWVMGTWPDGRVRLGDGTVMSALVVVISIAVVGVVTLFAINDRLRAVELEVGGLYLDGATEAGTAFCDAYEALYPSEVE